MSSLSSPEYLSSNFSMVPQSLELFEERGKLEDTEILDSKVMGKSLEFCINFTPR